MCVSQPTEKACVGFEFGFGFGFGFGSWWWTWVVDLGGIGLQLRTSRRGKRRAARRTILYFTTILHYSTLLYYTLLYELY